MTSPATGGAPERADDVEARDRPPIADALERPATAERAAVDPAVPAVDPAVPAVDPADRAVDPADPAVQPAPPAEPAGAASPSRRGGVRALWRRVKPSWVRPFSSWSLRNRIVVTVVALLAVLSIVVGATSVLVLQSYLVGRLDQQLSSAISRSQTFADHLFGTGPVDGRIENIVTGPAQPVGTLGVVLGQGSDVPLFARVLSPAGTTQAVEAYAQPILNLPIDGVPRTINLGPALHSYRVEGVRLANGDVMIIGLPLSDVDATVTRLILVISLVSVAAMLLAIALAELIVRLALRPLDQVVRTALTVSEMPLDRGDVALSIRVPKEDTDVHTEVGKVGAAFNRMLGHVGSALAARQASEQKVRQFVADASHELRTPLASIRGYSELTRRSPHELPDDVKHSIGRIESEATRMTSLVEDLLLLARLDEGRDLESRPVDLSMLLVDALSDAHAAGPDHQWSLELPDEPVDVPGDLARLHQVFANLLANARIHTPAGSEVKVTLTPADEHGRIAVTVSDNGPGIAPEIASTLFERFVRGDSSRTRATGSTGLGLAIVSAVVEAHGGTVHVDSEPGAGTSFRVELPA
jgi:two-component system OmpR family sensor kinase